MAKEKKKPGKKQSRNREPSPVLLTAAQIIKARGNLTRAEAAAKLGIKERTLMYYETGKQTPSRSLTILIKLLHDGTL